MSEYLKMPWSEEVTVENLKSAKEIIKNLVSNVNLDGMGEEDAEEVEFDFNRAIEALEKQIPKKATVEPLYYKGNPNPVDYYVKCECGKWICYPNEYEAKDNYKYCPKCGNRIEWDWSDEE